MNKFKYILMSITVVGIFVIGFGYSKAVSSQESGTVQIEAYVPEISAQTKEEGFRSLAGTIKKFSVEDQIYEYKNMVFYTEFQNTGEKNLKSTGYIVITNWLGKEVDRLPLNHDGIVVMPDKSITYDNIWSPQNLIGAGKYSANLVVNYGNNENLNAQIHFWIFPWKVTGISIFSLLALFMIHKLLEIELVGHGRAAWKATH